VTRVLVAFDKFKDALTARQACEAAAHGLRANHPDWTLDLCPLTDGGEGFCETLTNTARGRLVDLMCSEPLGEQIGAQLSYVTIENLPAPVRARLGLGGNSSLAVIEMATASGLALLKPSQRDPWQTSTYGTGEQILAAAQANVTAILLGVGGSATNDLGLGALAALGFKLLDVQGAVILRPTPATWDKIVRIEGRIKIPPVFIACDVANPLLGPTGATATFGPQKGLKAADFARLETQATRLAALLCDACDQPRTLAEMPGAGAAGGIAFGLMVATGAKLVSGFDLVSDWLDLPARLAAADLILTGEGRFDDTSLGGKGPGSLVAAAQRLNKPAYIFAGSLGLPANFPGLNGVKAQAITHASMPLVEALPRAGELLTAAVTRAF
jgi:glycerate kinase